MKVDNVWFGGADELQSYLELAEKKKDVINTGELENIYKSFTIALDLSEISLMEYFIMTECTSSCKILDIEYDLDKINLGPYQLDQDSLDIVEKSYRIFSVIEEESKLPAVSYIPTAACQLSLHVTLEGMDIIGMLGSQIQKIFEIDDYKDGIIQLFVQGFYSILNKKLYQVIPGQRNPGENLVNEFLQEELFSKISSDVIKLYKMRSSEGLYFHFIDSNDKIEDLIEYFKTERELRNIKISFILETSLYQYFYFMRLGFVNIHQPYKEVIENSKYITSEKLMNNYKTRITQMVEELHTQRVSAFNDDEKSLLYRSLLMPFNVPIQYVIEFPLDKLFQMNNINDKDLFQEEVEVINNTFETVRQVLKKGILTD